MKKAFILITFMMMFFTVFVGCSSSAEEEKEDVVTIIPKEEEPETTQEPEVIQRNPIIKITCNTDVAFSGKSLLMSVEFKDYDSIPNTVDVFIENLNTVYASNTNVNSNQITILIPSNYTSKTICFYVKAGEIESNHISLNYGYCVTVNELEDFVNSLTTSVEVLLKITGTYDDFKTKISLFKNENIRLNLDLCEIENLVIEDRLFKQCVSLVSLAIPDGIERIGKNAFERCSNLSGINLPDTISEIASDAFRSCTSLTKIVLPDNITQIAPYSFIGCEKLKEINLSENITSIGKYAFAGCAFETLKLPSKITTIEDGVFKECKKLYQIILHEGITEIKKEAFYCTRLKTVTLPSTLEKIGDYAFYLIWYDNFHKNEKLIIPAKVSYIGKDAFLKDYFILSLIFEETTGWKAGDEEISAEDLAGGRGLFYLAGGANSDSPYKGTIWTRTTE